MSSPNKAFADITLTTHTSIQLNVALDGENIESILIEDDITLALALRLLALQEVIKEITSLNPMGKTSGTVPLGVDTIERLQIASEWAPQKAVQHFRTMIRDQLVEARVGSGLVVYGNKPVPINTKVDITKAVLAAARADKHNA